MCLQCDSINISKLYNVGVGVLDDPNRHDTTIINKINLTMRRL